MDRAEKTICAFYLLAAVALAGLLAPRKWPRSATPLALASLALSLLCFGLGGYIAQAGGRVRHPEFRPRHSAERLRGERGLDPPLRRRYQRLGLRDLLERTAVV